MGKSVKVGGNFLNNIKFDTKDPSMWLNLVIVLLIVVVFVLLAVQVFTPRRDVIDGFVTIPISNRNLPWPFNDTKFDPLYYSLVFAGKTKNGSAHGDGVIYFSKSFMPVNKDNMPALVVGAGRADDGQQVGVADTYNQGQLSADGIKVAPKVDPRRATWKDEKTKGKNESTGTNEKLKKLKVDKHLREAFTKVKFNKNQLTFWKSAGGNKYEPTRAEADVKNTNTELWLPVSLLETYLELLKNKDLVKLIKPADSDKSKVKKLEEDLLQNNYENYLASNSVDSEDSLVLFEGTWNEGKLTKAIIKDCGKGSKENFILFYNDKEQLEDKQSVEFAVQFLRTPLYASCMGD